MTTSLCVFAMRGVDLKMFDAATVTVVGFVKVLAVGLSNLVTFVVFGLISVGFGRFRVGKFGVLFSFCSPNTDKNDMKTIV